MKSLMGLGLGVGLAVLAGLGAVGSDRFGSAAAPSLSWAPPVPASALVKSAPLASIPHREHAPGRVRRVVISIPDRKLALVADGRVVRVYDVAVGARVSPSPRGEFRIVTRIPEATYYHEGLVVPAGEQSPIGTRWIGLDRAGYGIHGTNAPRSIGKAASHGCIRMRNRDAEEFFELVQVGDAVEIRDEEVAELVGGVASGM